MEQWIVALLILAAITVAMIGQGWVSFLEHHRRKQAMDVIKAAIEAGKDVPQEIYDQLNVATGPTGQEPWTEVVIFTALSVGFAVGFATSDGERQMAFLAITAAMMVTAVGCLILALMRRSAKRRRNGGQ
jgi:hypothetical protein